MKLKKISLIIVLIIGFFCFKLNGEAKENYYETLVNLKIYIQDYKFENNEIVYSYIPKSGITYGIYDLDNKLISTVESGLSGEATYHGSLLSGKYYFQMIYSKNFYYVKDTKKYYFEVKDQEDESLQVYNELIEIRVNIRTYSLNFEITNEEKEALEGVVVKLLDDKYNLILELSTDNKGIAITYLPTGSYHIVLPKNVINLKNNPEIIDINVSGANFYYSLIIKESVEEEDNTNEEESKESENDTNDQDSEDNEKKEDQDGLDSSNTLESSPKQEEDEKVEEENKEESKEENNQDLLDESDNKDENLNTPENDSLNGLENKEPDNPPKEEYIDDKSNESEEVKEEMLDSDINHNLFESNITDFEEIKENILSGTISDINKNNSILDTSNIGNKSLTASVITKNSNGQNLFSLIIYIITAFGLLMLRFIRI